MKKSNSIKNIGVQIGGDFEYVKKTLPELTIAIMKIFGSNAGDEVKKAAINMLGNITSTSGNSINDSNFKMGEDK